MTPVETAYVVLLGVLAFIFLVWVFPGNDDPDWRAA